MAESERLVEHVAELRRRIGNRRTFTRMMAARGIGLSTAGVPEGDDVEIDGTLESIPEGVVVDATVTVPWVGECRRCLSQIDGRATADVREIFETHPTDGETWPLAGDLLDLGPLVRETALLALPLAPLCADDCRGPAPDSFPAVVAGVQPSTAPDGHDPRADDDRPIDPRWAALDELKNGRLPLEDS